MKYKYKEIPILALLMVDFLFYMTNMNFIYFYFAFEHYPQF